ncbi:MAG: DUF86 domain-containing protein [bacterium]|nr:DUF86 domain-containing protein [bacterium]
MRDDRAYLEDILEAIERVQRYSGRGRGAFDADELIQTWVVHHIQILGEAVGKLSDDFKQRHPEVPWALIKAMRNVLVHYYYGIDLDKVWGVVERELPTLKQQAQLILDGGPS